MKPTESGIKGLLIEGWEITGIQSGLNPVWVEIANHKSSLRVGVFNNACRAVSFDCHRQPLHEVKLADFLSGNYDLSAISQHYEPEEWQRIITMCERIVRLITGEQVEQSLEEKVREILEPAADISELKVTDHSVEFLDNSKPPMWYFVTSSEISYVPQEAPKCRNTFTIREYRNNYGDTPEINAALPKVAALLTAQPESEQTLEEAVRGIVSDTDLIVSYVHDNEVSLDSGMAQHYYVSANSVKTPGTTLTLDDYVISDGKYIAEFQAIAALLSTRSTKPSYSDLEQRVEELEKEVSKRNGKVSVLEHQLKAARERAEYLENQNAELFKQNARLIRERDEAESKLQDCPTEKDMEDFEQLYDKEMARKDRMIAALRKDKDHLQEKANLYQFAVEQSIKCVMEASQ